MMISEEELYSMYWLQEMSQKEISEVYGVSQSTVGDWMKKYKIESRTNSESLLIKPTNPLKPSKNDLEKMYLKNQMTIFEIANKIGVSYSAVLNWMKSYNIKSRTNSESQLGIHCGEDNSNWKGGISFEPYCKRFDNKFKEAVRKRDGFTCQLCGFEQNGQKLDVHHVHYDKKNCYPDVVALCHPCNSKVNANRDYWEEYFENQLIERGLYCWSFN